MASTLQQKLKDCMIEKQSINGREVWLKINPYRVQRANPNIIPTEYFTATWYLADPEGGNLNGETVNDEEGAPKLFESPVAALNFTRKRLESIV
jgi:hypothetical protein